MAKRRGTPNILDEIDSGPMDDLLGKKAPKKREDQQAEKKRRSTH